MFPIATKEESGVRGPGPWNLEPYPLIMLIRNFATFSMTSMPVTAQSGLSQMNPQARLCVGAYGED